MFNKELFITRIEFFVRHWHAIGAKMMHDNPLETVQLTMNFFWVKALEVLWQTRNENHVIIGIDEPENYYTFCNVLTIGLNQMNAKIQFIQKQYPSKAIAIVEMNKVIKEQIAAIAEDVEELLLTTQKAENNG